MDSIRFQAQSQTPLRPEVMNHSTASPLRQNQIQLHIGSAYLQDFTDQGIEKFIKQHQPSGAKLSVQDVKAFVQSLAQQAPSVKGMTFDLADPQLGLAEDDTISARHFQKAFTLNVSDRSVLPQGQARDIRFVDVESVSFDLKNQEDTVSAARREIETSRSQIDQIKDNQRGLQRQQRTAQTSLGGNAQARLEQALSDKTRIEGELKSLDTQETAYQEELKTAPAGQPRHQELKRMLSGLAVERTELKAQLAQLNETLDGKEGPLLERYSLNDLNRINRQISNNQRELGRLESRIQQQQQVIDTARQPAAAAASPAAENTADASAATQTGDGPGEVPEEVPVQAGASVDLAALRQLPPRQQAQRLVSMSAEQQRSTIGSLNADERVAIQQEAASYVRELQGSNMTQFSRERRLQDYQTLITQLENTPMPTSAQPAAAQPAAAQPAAAQPAAAQPAAAQPAAAQPAAATSTTQTTTTVRSQVTVGAAQANLPEGALVSKGKPLMANGQVITTASFQTLTMEDKFTVLMKADDKHLVDLLRSLGKEGRAAIKEMSKKVVDEYLTATGGVGLQTATVISAPAVSVASTGTGAVVSGGATVVTSQSGSVTMTAESRERLERAQLLIRLIDQLDREEAGGATVTQTTQTTTSRTLGPNEYRYTVKPGDTPRAIAERELRDYSRTYEVFQLNPGLDQAMQQRGVQNRHSEKLDAYQEYKELILSRTPVPSDPVTSAPLRRPAPPPAANPTVQEAPAAQPAPARPAATPASRPAAQPAAAPAQPAAPPAAPPVETVKLTVEEVAPTPAPAAAPQPATPTPRPEEPAKAAQPEPAPQPAPQPAARPRRATS